MRFRRSSSIATVVRATHKSVWLTHQDVNRGRSDEDCSGVRLPAAASCESLRGAAASSCGRGGHGVLHGDLQDLVLSAGDGDAALFLAGEETAVGGFALVLGHGPFFVDQRTISP